MNKKSYLILGGARSGKTKRALALADRYAAANSQKIYLATAEPLDQEMRQRIERHQAERQNSNWSTIECPLAITDIISQAKEDSIILIDCLTLWLSNIMHQNKDVQQYTTELTETIATTRAILIFVSNEVGLGIVPHTELGRTFRDEQGWLNQNIAQSVDHVEVMIAGLPLLLKP